MKYSFSEHTIDLEAVVSEIWARISQVSGYHVEVIQKLGVFELKLSEWFGFEVNATDNYRILPNKCTCLNKRTPDFSV